MPSRRDRRPSIYERPRAGEGRCCDCGKRPRIERLDGGSSSISITFVPALRAIDGGRS
jgi:hypothetical protein